MEMKLANSWERDEIYFSKGEADTAREGRAGVSDVAELASATRSNLPTPVIYTEIVGTR